MRPLRLLVEGFTAFRQPQEMDLEALDLFAIVGPTGSGKSSLLDAMTYALYGEVSRVEDSQTPLRELVSHGLPWMKVMLDFQVGAERYRVTRRTPANAGTTKVMLERFTDGTPRQYGEGADRVNEVNRIVRQLVGLDYDGFTRSVLLPQGKFAELLNGKAEDRRRLLNDLLDLWLFDRLGKQARALAAQASADAEANERLIQQEYSEATPEALAIATAAASSAEAREKALSDLSSKLDDLLERFKDLERSAASLERCSAEAGRMTSTVREVERRLDRLLPQLREAERGLAAAQGLEKDAQAAADAATTEVEEAEGRWGNTSRLAEAVATARRLSSVHAELSQRGGRLDALRETLPQLDDAVAKRRLALQEAEAALTAAVEELTAAREEEEAARHADLLAAVAVGVSVGDPCPVCGTPLGHLPERPGAPVLDDAIASRQQKEDSWQKTRERLDRYRDELEEARRAKQAREDEIRTLLESIDERQAEAATMQDEIVAVLRDSAGDDPIAVIQRRKESLDGLIAAEKQAVAALAQARERRFEAERRRDALVAEIQGEGRRLELDIDSLLERARHETEEELSFSVPSPEEPQDPEGALAYAKELRRRLERFAHRLRALAEDRRSEGALLLAEARNEAAHLLPHTERLIDYHAAAREAYVRARDDAVRSHARAEEVGRALEKRKTIEARAKELRSRAGLFSALAGELRANRIIDFLQGEALRMLSAAGSRHLVELSRGRYRLEYERDEFYVVDADNADERRSVRTLSGGETFLASLSLALALSEEVRSLSVTEKAPLDSLFLDEGFGTLDPETLEDVAQAIEQLGSDGRLVGIVTHVRDLADRLPVRVEVDKTPAGSRVRVLS